MASVSPVQTQRIALTSGGFEKLSEGVNEKKEKVKLYGLTNLERKTIKAAEASLKNVKAIKNKEYKGKIEKFKKEIKNRPYLLREGNLLRLVSKEEANQIIDKYKISSKKIKKMSGNAVQLLKDNNITTDADLIQFYNNADANKRNILLPLFNSILGIFQKNRSILSPGEVKTITLLATCDNDDIRRAALDVMLKLFEESNYQNVNYGYGLKYLLDELSPEFLNKNQLKLITIFDKLSDQIKSLCSTGRSVNHEIEPLMAALNSTARATLKSGVQELDKEVKGRIYKKLTDFYKNEEYDKRIRSLSASRNYLLEFQALWPIQHLVRIPSDEHKAITFVRKTGHGLYAARKLVGGAAEAFIGLTQHGKLPDESIVSNLQAAYKHGKIAFGIKDIPRPWYDMLEVTEEVLLDPKVTEETLDNMYQIASQYDQMRHKFNEVVVNNLKKIVGEETVSLKETKQFAFGFVGQLSDVAMDSSVEGVRHKALELLGRIFREGSSSQDVRVLILTTLENIIKKEGSKSIDIEKAKKLKEELHTIDNKLENTQLFRATKYTCLALIPAESSSLLNEAKKELEGVSSSEKALPSSEFLFNPIIKNTFGELEVEEDFNVYHMSADYAIKLAQQAREQHRQLQEKNDGAIAQSTVIKSTTETIITGKTVIKGNANFGFPQ